MSNDATALITVESQAYAVDAALAGSAESCPACSTNIAAGETYCPRCGYQRGTWAASSGAGSAAAAGEASSLSGREAAPWSLDGPDGISIALVSGEQVFGRGEVEHRLEDSFVSRRHAKVIASADKVVLEDLGSSNGSFIGGVRLVPGEQHALGDGDSFRLGQTDFVLRRSEVSPANTMEDGTALISSAEPAGDPTLVEGIPVADTPAEPAAPADTAATEISVWTLKREGFPELVLPVGVTTLGRRADRASLVLEGDSYISGLHCELEVSEEKVVLTDLGSTNGTYIGDVRLEPNAPEELADGALFRVGQTELSLSRA